MGRSSSGSPDPGGGISTPRSLKNSRILARLLGPGRRRPCSYIPRALGLIPTSRPSSPWVKPKLSRASRSHCRNIRSPPLSSIVPKPRRKNNPWSVDYPDTGTAEKRRLTAEEICGTLELRTNVLFLRGSPSPRRSTNPAGVLPLRRQGGNSAGSVSPGGRKDAPLPGGTGPAQTTEDL